MSSKRIDTPTDKPFKLPRLEIATITSYEDGIDDFDGPLWYDAMNPISVQEEAEGHLARAVVRTMMSAARQQGDGRNQLFDEFSILRNNPQATHGTLTLSQSPTSKSNDDGHIPRIRGRQSSTSSTDSNPQSFVTCSTSATSEGDMIQDAPPLPDATERDPNDRDLQSSCLNCNCRCHHPLRDSQHSSPLASWLKDIRIPNSLRSLVTSVALPCDVATCTRTRSSLGAIRRWLPTWFARTEAVIRSRSLPLQFIMQTPRIVPSLQFLYSISLDDFRTQLMKKQITVNDMEQDSFTVLHVRLILIGLDTYTDIST